MEMVKRSLVAAAVLLVCLALPAAAAVAGEKGQVQGVFWLPSGSACTGTLAECLGREEFDMDSEVNRRMLAAANTDLGKLALSQASTPCSISGASYGNCQPNAVTSTPNKPNTYRPSGKSTGGATA